MADKFDILMRVLDIMAQDQPGPMSDTEHMKMSQVIEQIQGNFIFQYSSQEGGNVAGDNFQNISNSIIATHGSIAKGVIKINDAVNAINALADAIAALTTEDLSAAEKQEALELLDEVTKHAAGEQKPKSVIRSIGESLLGILEKAAPIASVVSKVWPHISALWK